MTKRQTEILKKIVKEHIVTAQPVSSQSLEEKYNWGISPATIRIEMQRLTDQGYLYQPHTSAGRVPTDKGYRFFVDEIIKRKDSFFEIGDWIEKEIENVFETIQHLTKRLSQFSKTLTLTYLEKERIIWKEGWEEVLKEPEFKERRRLFSFVELLEELEENMERLAFNSEINIYIGRESNLRNCQDFAILTSRNKLPDQKEGIFSLVGPKRMNYDKNIKLMRSLARFLEKL